MPHVITARDGRNHTVFDERDILSLIDEYAGPEVRRCLEDWLEEQGDAVSEAQEIAKEYETENGKLRGHMRLVISEMYEEASWILKLLGEPRPKRSELQECAHKIWDALNEEI